MININEKLNILYYNGSTYTDYTNELAEYGRDSATITLASTDSIYVGFYKPINTFYLYLTTANTNTIAMTLQYWNGSAFAAPVGFYNDTNGLKRSGFIRWDRNQVAEAKTTINASERYWYKIDVDTDTTEMIIAGLNILFSDDQDLKSEVPSIDKMIPDGFTDHILSHVAARNELIRDLRSDGRYKEDLSTGKLKDITAFDLLDISQVKLASTYLALSKIFLNSSDDPLDTYNEKSKVYKTHYTSTMNMFYLNVDEDDDGIQDTSEELDQNSPQLARR